MASRDIVFYYYEKINNTIEYKCKLCQTIRKQAAKKGYSNLMSHLDSKHPTYRYDYIQRIEGESLAASGFVNSKLTFICGLTGSLRETYRSTIILVKS